MAQLSSACPDCSQLMDTLEETAVCDIMLYTILLEEDLRYTEGICLVLSAWRMQLTVNLVKQKVMCSGGEIVYRSVDIFYL